MTTKTAFLDLPANFETIPTKELAKWCKRHWNTIEREHITAKNLQALCARFNLSKTAKTKHAAVGVLRKHLFEEKTERQTKRKRESSKDKEEEEEEDELKRKSRKPKRIPEGKDDEDQEPKPAEEEAEQPEQSLELTMALEESESEEDKEPEQPGPTQLLLPDRSLPVKDRAAFLLRYSLEQLGMVSSSFLFFSSIFYCFANPTRVGFGFGCLLYNFQHYYIRRASDWSESRISISFGGTEAQFLSHFAIVLRLILMFAHIRRASDLIFAIFRTFCYCLQSDARRI